MENSVNSKKPFGLVIAAMLVSAAAVFVPILYLVVPALYAAVLIRTGSVRLVLPLFAPAIIIVFVIESAAIPESSLISDLSLVLMGILCGIAIWQCQKRRVGGFFTAAAAAAAAALGIYSSICLPGILSGEGAFTAVQQSVSEMPEIMRQILEPAATPETQPMIEQYLAMLNSYTDSVEILLVPVMCSLSCILALCNFLLFRLMIRKHTAELGISRLNPFREWQIPSSFTFGMAVLLIGTLIVRLADWEDAVGISNTVSVVIGFPLIVQGMSLLDFLIERSKSNHTVKRVLLYTACGVLFAILSTMLTMTGCFEQFFRVRKKLSAAGPAEKTTFRGDRS